MVFISADNKNIFYNLATEEYFFKHFRDEVLFLWQSEPSVVVGKHQNTYAEINYRYIKKNAINVARRLSGGGAVYHDNGNLNYTFIKNAKFGKLVDFKGFLIPIINSLSSLGVTAIQGEKNDLRVDNKKISGNAEHIYKNRVLHHGTLLFSSDLDKLNKSVANNSCRYKDKAVSSNRSEVANLSEYLKDMNMLQFIDSMQNEILKFFKGIKKYQLNQQDIKTICEIQKTKYETWEWIYAYSPVYEFNNRIVLDGNEFDVTMKVNKGIINDFRLYANKGQNRLKNVEKEFLNCRHNEPDLMNLIPGICNIMLWSTDQCIHFINELF